MANFRDLDVAAGGPAVREISSVFDHFWNGDWAVPISALVDRPYTDADLRQARATLRERIAADNYPHPIDQDTAELKSALHAKVVVFDRKDVFVGSFNLDASSIHRTAEGRTCVQT